MSVPRRSPTARRCHRRWSRKRLKIRRYAAAIGTPSRSNCQRSCAFAIARHRDTGGARIPAMALPHEVGRTGSSKSTLLGIGTLLRHSRASCAPVQTHCLRATYRTSRCSRLHPNCIRHRAAHSTSPAESEIRDLHPFSISSAPSASAAPSAPVVHPRPPHPRPRIHRTAEASPRSPPHRRSIARRSTCIAGPITVRTVGPAPRSCRPTVPWTPLRSRPRSTRACRSGCPATPRARPRVPAGPESRSKWAARFRLTAAATISAHSAIGRGDSIGARLCIAHLSPIQ